MMRCSLVTIVMTTGDLFKERQDFEQTTNHGLSLTHVPGATLAT